MLRRVFFSPLIAMEVGMIIELAGPVPVPVIKRSHRQAMHRSDRPRRAGWDGQTSQAAPAGLGGQASWAAPGWPVWPGGSGRG